jgi:hypothetical protein
MPKRTVAILAGVVLSGVGLGLAVPVLVDYFKGPPEWCEPFCQWAWSSGEISRVAIGAILFIAGLVVAAFLGKGQVTKTGADLP